MRIHNYQSDSGRDLIMEYIDSLTEDERVDALSVLECKNQTEKKDKKIVVKRAKELGRLLGKTFI